MCKLMKCTIMNVCHAVPGTPWEIRVFFTDWTCKQGRAHGGHAYSSCPIRCSFHPQSRHHFHNEPLLEAEGHHGDIRDLMSPQTPSPLSIPVSFYSQQRIAFWVKKNRVCKQSFGQYQNGCILPTWLVTDHTSPTLMAAVLYSLQCFLSDLQMSSPRL